MNTCGRTLRLSWSQLRAHGECRQKSYLLRTGHRPKGNNIRMYFHGMVVDRAMREWLGSPSHTVGGMQAAVDEMIDVVAREAKDDGDGIVRWRTSEDRREMREFCVELVRRLEPILRQRVLPFGHEVAKRFAVDVKIPDLDGQPTPIVLVGEMDLLVNDDGPVIWDLKGTKDDQYFRKVIGQLIFYDLAVYAASGKPSRLTGLIQPMCTETVLEFPINDDQRRQMWSRIIGLAHDIWRENKDCKDGTVGCTRCEVRHACQRYQPGTADSFMGLAVSLRQAAKEEQP